MAQRHQLDSADRAFLRLVAQAAFSNPFSEDRPKLHEVIVGSPGMVDNPHRFLPKLVARVSDTVNCIGLLPHGPPVVPTVTSPPVPGAAARLGWQLDRGFRRGWPVAQTAMGPDRVALGAPGLDQYWCLYKRVEDLPVKGFVAELIIA